MCEDDGRGKNLLVIIINNFKLLQKFVKKNQTLCKNKSILIKMRDLYMNSIYN